MSTLKTHNLQSPDASSVNIAMTPNAGIVVTGIATFNNNVKLLDDDKLLLGTGEDLKIYHDGSHSYVDDTGTGNLILRSNVFRLRSPADEEMIIANENGNVKLYHDNSKKIETTSDGATVTGSLTVTDDMLLGDDLLRVIQMQ